MSAEPRSHLAGGYGCSLLSGPSGKARKLRAGRAAAGLGIAVLLLAMLSMLTSSAPTAPSPTRAADGSATETDVHYNGPDGPSLDVYRPTGGSHRPAVLVVHGGGWIGLSR